MPSALLVPPTADAANADALATPPNGYVTAEEFLAWEHDAETKHEWIDGEVREAPGVSIEHALIGPRVRTVLGQALDGLGLFPLSAELKIRIPDGPYYYCDGSFVRPPIETEPPIRRGGPRTVLRNPTVIVEVLSGSTADVDRVEKRDHYRRIPSLTDYLIFDQSAPALTHHRRTAPGVPGVWAKDEHAGPDAAFTLAAGGAAVRLGDVYAALAGLGG